MTSEQLLNDLLRQEENDLLEFKEIARKDAVGKTICGFLNNKGGQLLLGIGANKEIKGLIGAEKLRLDLEHFLLKELVPEAPVMVSIERYGEKELLLIKVWEGSKQPYIFKGSIYYRKKDKTIQATSKEISELIHKRTETEIHWERQIASGVELEDMDMEEILKSMDASLSENRMDEVKKEPMDFLSYYGLLQNGNFTNAAVILFAKNPARFIPQARVRVSLLKKGKTGDVFADDRLLEGNIFKNRMSILDFFNRHLLLKRKFDNKDWEREDDYEIPMKALREGVMNALVHRDYSMSSGAMSVIIYSDKIDITNTGKSPYKQNELKKSHLSMPYNPDIAHMVFLRGFIEKIGRGTILISEECKRAGLKAPVWDIGDNTVRLTFTSNTQIGGAIEGTVEGANEGANEGAIEGAIEGATKRVKDNLANLLQAINNKEGNRVPEYKVATGLSDSTIERYIKQLRDAGLIEFKGDAAHTGGYYLTIETKEKLK